jgi:ribokinase
MHDEPRPIVVVGSINMDLVSRVPSIPRGGQTIFGTDFQTHPGGKGANQAVGIARLAHPVKMIGMLGRDAFGKQLRDQLDREGVDTSGIGDSDTSTGTATILVDDAGQNCIVVTPGANLELTPDVLRENISVLRSAGIVLAQLEIPVETVLCLAELCESMHIPLILDPAPAIDLRPEILHRVSWFTPNETEAEFYAGASPSDADLTDTLLATGIRGLILKRGAQGCIVVGEDRVQHRILAPVVRAIDTTAAGDAFNAAFAVFLIRGHDPVASANFASLAAAISVTRAGAQPSLATAQEVTAAIPAEVMLAEHLQS